MKLFLPECRSCKKKIYLSAEVPTKSLFKEKFGEKFSATCVNCGNAGNYSVAEVVAEPSAPAAPAGGLLAGSLLGIVAGPLGMLIGAVLGTSVGAGVLIEETTKTSQFNKS